MTETKAVTDEELALSYVNGDNKAFDLLLERNQSKLFAYILFVVRNQDVANDIFQETFVRVITRLHERRYLPSGKFSAWIVRIAHNVIMDWYRERRQKNITEPTADNDLSLLTSQETMNIDRETEYINEQTLDDVRKIMDDLPPVQREIVYMRFYQKIRFKEIAEITGVSINTALGRMRYALNNMRHIARKYDITPPID